MRNQNTIRSGKTPGLADYRRSIERLPVTMRPALHQQLARWETLFPFEQNNLTGFLDGIDSFSPEALNALTAKLRALEVKMDVGHWNFSETNDTLENAGQLARSAYFAEWRSAVQEVYQAIETSARSSAHSEPEQRRLILLFLPENLPVDPAAAWKQWGTQGREIKIAGDSRELRELVAGRQPGQPGICALLKQRESYDSADLWFIDADARLKDALTSSAFSAASCLSYEALKPFRDNFLAELNTIPKDMAVADRTISTLRQTNWKRWWPSELAGQERLLNFMVNLFLSGNGALIFSNAFVEWAASEALRRARPQVVVACFGMRSKPKPFTGIAIFENQEKISPVPNTDDPENSAVDAAILAHYLWLAAGRYSEYDGALCLCVAEHPDSAYVVAPPEMNLRPGTGPVAPKDIYTWIASWIAS
ncbi:MAG: hypothetical protein ABSE51_12235 [Terracidiphilus sp.]|jgi:hypothetical protein